MTERQKDLLIKFFAGERHVDDPDLHFMLALDDLAKPIYSRHVVGNGLEAYKVSCRKVIDEILKIE